MPRVMIQCDSIQLDQILMFWSCVRRRTDVAVEDPDVPPLASGTSSTGLFTPTNSPWVQPLLERYIIKRPTTTTGAASPTAGPPRPRVKMHVDALVH